MSDTISKEELATLLRTTAEDVVNNALENRKSATADLADGIIAALAKGQYSHESKPVKIERVIGRTIRSLINARFDPDRAISDIKAEKYGKDKGMIEAVERAMEAGNATAGGFMLSPAQSDEIIEELKSKAVVRAAGPMYANLDVGVMNVGKETEGASAYYIGEGRAIPASSVQMGNVTLTARKLAAKVALSNDLLLYSNDMADMIVRRSIVRGMRVREDRAFLRGMQSEFSPRGLRYWADPNNITESNGTDLADIRQDILELIGALEDADVPMENCHFFMAPRSKNHLMWNAADGNGNLVFAKELASGNLAGYPVHVTTSIPTNLGGGAESEIMFADLADVIIGDASQIMLSSSDSASYDDEDGNTISAFDTDQTVVKAIARHDLVARRSQAIAVKTAVEWGAAA